MQLPRTWPRWARAYVQVFRTVVVATCIGFAAYGWLAHVPWLLAAAVTIGIGELVECTYYLVVLDWGERTGRTRTRLITPPPGCGPPKLLAHDLRALCQRLQLHLRHEPRKRSQAAIGGQV